MGNLDPFGQKLVGAFHNMRSPFRTLGGLAEDTGFSPQRIAGYIHGNPGICSASSLTPGGDQLYVLNPKLRDW